jgi:predicted small secreted protein
MKPVIRKISAIVLLGSFVLALGACNTVKGLGKDTEKAGEKIQKESREHGAD